VVSLKPLGDIMKNQRILRRKKLEKNYKKKVKRLKRTKNIKQDQWNRDKIKREVEKLRKTRGVGNA
tara:strand:- start:250 stop:447 length:198 start_codon:yes stop_codon:yes gene_type:complete